MQLFVWFRRIEVIWDTIMKPLILLILSRTLKLVSMNSEHSFEQDIEAKETKKAVII